jgi:hypothetical protein
MHFASNTTAVSVNRNYILRRSHGLKAIPHSFPPTITSSTTTSKMRLEYSTLKLLVAIFSLTTGSIGQTPPPLPATGVCTSGGTPAPRYPLNVASGWRVGAVLSGLRSPRGITMDKEGHLLIVQRGLGISAHTLGPDGCITATKLVVNQTDLNHGIEVSPDGAILYAR